MSRLGMMLNLYMASRGIGVRELGRMLGVSAATVSRITHGKQIDLATGVRLWMWMLSTEKK